MMSFWEHVEELRKILLRSFCIVIIAACITFLFHERLIALLLIPLQYESLYLFSPTEGLTLVFKLSFFGGLLLSSPLWGYLLLQFLLPALKAKERRFLLPFFLLSLLFIGAGIAFAYSCTLPLVTQFFRQFNHTLGENVWGASATLNYALTLILAHGVVFELYVILLFLIHFHVLHPTQLKRGRRLMIVTTLLVAALLTPPDLLSQLLLALPMLLLYEGALLYAHFHPLPKDSKKI